jgi:hypothetical protein
MLHHKAKSLREVSMDCAGWNADEASQLPNRREWILLNGIKHCLNNNERR